MPMSNRALARRSQKAHKVSMSHMCGGSGRHAAGHRYQWRKKLVACEWCLAWFHNDDLLYHGSKGPVATGIIPDHQRTQR